ncbi:hypothetical protein H2199_008836 [Coniosporium tulheliwenetii]|uniref:Uncharacterized protein n=1 Tax=Coniosporium tulheliwenetii TaxID=3383036 RepID=A0ACC2YH03_9PEZI|nr:hypothetical protein H2199_008836 [Cladosporium sp. JES 115]
MATTAITSTFRVPPGFNLLDNNHFYNGPPAAKPSQKKHFRKSRSNTLNRPFLDHGWTDIDTIIDEIDGTVLGPNAELGAESVLTPTTKRAKTFGLLYSDGETDSEDDVHAQHEREGGRPRDSGSPRAQGEDLGDGNLNRPLSTNGSSQEDPVMIADDTEPEDYPTSPEGSIELDQDRSGRLESVQSADKASTSDTGDGNQPETHDTISEADRALASSEPNRVGSADDGMIDSVTDNQAHSSCHENRSTAVEMIDDTLAAPKHTHGDDRITSDRSSTENNKRKRCQTADTDDLGSQTPDTALERPLEDQLFNAQAGKQQIPRSSLSATVATVSSLQEREPSRLTRTKSSHDVLHKRRRTVRSLRSNAEPEVILPSPVLPQTSNSTDMPPWYGRPVSESSGLAQQSLSNITIHPLPSSNMAFVTAIIRDSRDIVTLLAAPSVTVLQDAPRKLVVNVNSLPSDLWLLTGIIHNSSDGANSSLSNIAKPNHTHRDGEERTTRCEVPARYDEEWLSDDSEHSSDSDLSENDPNYDNEGLEDDEEH